MRGDWGLLQSTELPAESDLTRVFRVLGRTGSRTNRVGNPGSHGSEAVEIRHQGRHVDSVIARAVVYGLELGHGAV